MLQAISALRSKLSGRNPKTPDDLGIVAPTTGNLTLVPVDKNGIAFSRTTGQVRARRQKQTNCTLAICGDLMQIADRLPVLTYAPELSSQSAYICLQVVNIVSFGSPNGTGGFFPMGLNGKITKGLRADGT